MLQKKFGLSTGSRTALCYALLIVVIMGLFAVSLTAYLAGRLEKRTEEELSQQVGLLVNTVSAYHAALADSAGKLASVFGSYFPGRFALDRQRTIMIEGRPAAVLKSGSTTLDLNTEIVDRFTAVTGAVGTVFVRSGDDFVRVATSLKKEDGSRAIGTLLERKHPAYRGLLQGHPYAGKATLFGKDYMTSYRPVLDARGQVIAVLFIGLDFTDSLKTLKDKIRNTRVARTGYLYVLDAGEGSERGKLQVHPYLEGQNILEARDTGGQQFIREILRQKAGVIRYHWTKDAGEPAPQLKLVVYRELKEWNWIICAGAWLDELNAETRRLRIAMAGATALVAGILVLLFTTVIRTEKRLVNALTLRIEDYQLSQEELQATEEMLREQVEEYHETHDHLLATEEMLRVQLEAVEESSQRFRAVFHNSPITATLTDLPAGTFSEVNRFFTEMFGYSREEVIGSTTQKLGIWCDEADRDRFLQHLLKDGSVHNFETTLRRKNGEEFAALISGTRLEITGTLCTLSAILDITEQKRLQRELHQTQKMDVVGQLAGGIAHDFNNMLTGIMAAAECLKLMLTDDGGKLKMVNTIIGAASRSAELTRDLLSFSRKEKGASGQVNIHHTIDCATALLERTIDKNIRVQKRLTARHAYVTGDAGQLQNALLNLGINARDAMPDGGTLSYATSEIALDEDACRRHGISVTPGHYLEIAVSDTGTGMSAATREHIFEPFFTTKGVGKGTGLGLAAVYGTVRNHGGEIRVQSQPGTGSVFKIYLPRAAAPAAGLAPGRPEDEEAVTGSGGILLVDDEEILRAVGRDLLEDLGYTVFAAADGEEALRLYAEHKDAISLAILDMIMPKMGGSELFLRLRETTPGLRVLFCTGFYREGADRELLGLGASGLIQKPYSRIELSRAVSAALGGEMATPPPSPPRVSPPSG